MKCKNYCTDFIDYICILIITSHLQYVTIHYIDCNHLYLPTPICYHYFIDYVILRNPTFHMLIFITMTSRLRYVTYAKHWLPKFIPSSLKCKHYFHLLYSTSRLFITYISLTYTSRLRNATVAHHHLHHHQVGNCPQPMVDCLEIKTF